MSDLELIESILAGDREAFSVLMERHQSQVARIVAAHVPGDRVEEIAHDSFVRAYKSLGGYRPKAPFRNWMTTIALRTCHDFWRTQYRRKETVLSDMTQDHQSLLDAMCATDSVEEFEKMARLREARETLDALLANLAPLDRMILTMTYLEERSVKETAEMLGISAANVKIRSFRARKKLKKLQGSLGIPGREHVA